MKTIFLTLISAGILFFNLSANNILLSKEHSNKYCAKMMNGKLTVMHEGKEVTRIAVLTNGTKIEPDGTITKKDGTKLTLKVGECMDTDGKIMKENPKSK
jgi:hypothetical protein